MTRERTQLSIRRTGGLAGLAMVASVDTHELDEDEAEHLSSALEGLDLDNVTKAVPANPHAADSFHYKLHIRRGDTEHSVSFSEREMPPELAPVVRALMDRAEPGPPAS